MVKPLFGEVRDGLDLGHCGIFAALLVIAIVFDLRKRRGMARSFTRDATGLTRQEALRARRVEAARLDAASGVPPRTDGGFGGTGSP